ncbi:TPA: ead/Ea22-like family protein [Escherichia coli]|nr:ead/Ea22-like family protein [Escherichia coli]QME17342.1 ead/Ea22-like family protein [Escherichia coli]HCJ5717763.1 ead/Ea22-like family protein [Escherichia coli]HDW3708531.1 ead/Ea22-like family protein [Escherichia coli]
MSNINYQALRMAAENATPGEWCSDDYGLIADAGLNANYYIASCSGPDNRANKRFIAAANPATVLALLDELENKVIPVSAELPPANESVLLFDANGEGWLIGWRSLWYTWGQKETGEWQWTFQVGDLENVNITHWAVMPKAPEAGA